MNIELLHGTLEATEDPGLKTIDPRFTDIATLVQEGNYEQAAAQSQAVLEEEIYDIRIIGYFLYGHFLDQGIEAMADIYQCLTDLLRDNLEALGPAKKREKHIQTILTWIMKQLIKKLQYEEGKEGGPYEAWMSEVSSDQVQEALDAGDELRRVLGPVLEDAAGPVLDGLMKITDWLTAFRRLVYKEPEPEDEEEPDEWEEEEADEEIEEEAREEVRKEVFVSAPPVQEDVTGVEGSYHLKLLMRKLDAFDRLIAQEKFPLAALVADDINTIIANFDPKVYFPKLFTGFSLQFARHVNELASYEEYKGSVGWQAMEELYKVDLDSFLSFDSEGIDLGVSGISANLMESNENPDEYEEGTDHQGFDGEDYSPDDEGQDSSDWE